MDEVKVTFLEGQTHPKVFDVMLDIAFSNRGKRVVCQAYGISVPAESLEVVYWFKSTHGWYTAASLKGWLRGFEQQTSPERKPYFAQL